MPNDNLCKIYSVNGSHQCNRSEGHSGPHFCCSALSVEWPECSTYQEGVGHCYAYKSVGELFHPMVNGTTISPVSHVCGGPAGHGLNHVCQCGLHVWLDDFHKSSDPFMDVFEQGINPSDVVREAFYAD